MIMPNFRRKFRMRFFIDVKWKWSASVGYWVTMWPWLLTSPMTLTFNFSRLKSDKMVWNKNKTIQLDTGLTVWSCLLTYDFGLIWGMGGGGGGGLIDMERKGCELIIHDHDRDLWVTTMVGWVDVPYSDWGDFRRWRAVDISSYYHNCYYYWYYYYNHYHYQYHYYHYFVIVTIIIIIIIINITKDYTLRYSIARWCIQRKNKCKILHKHRTRKNISFLVLTVFYCFFVFLK